MIEVKKETFTIRGEIYKRYDHASVSLIGCPQIIEKIIEKQITEETNGEDKS